MKIYVEEEVYYIWRLGRGGEWREGEGEGARESEDNELKLWKFGSTKGRLSTIKNTVLFTLNITLPLDIFWSLTRGGGLFKAYRKSEKFDNVRFLEIYRLVGVTAQKTREGVIKERKA